MMYSPLINIPKEPDLIYLVPGWLFDRIAP